tara:strand:- start:2176 stop:2406 length:231 start_codon:yes stop_codon:yes gene_type:complete
MNIGPTTNLIIDSCINEVNKKETKEKILKYIVDPLILDLSKRYYPYFVTIIVILVLIIILLGLQLSLYVMEKRNNS